MSDATPATWPCVSCQQTFESDALACLAPHIFLCAECASLASDHIASKRSDPDPAQKISNSQKLMNALRWTEHICFLEIGKFHCLRCMSERPRHTPTCPLPALLQLEDDAEITAPGIHDRIAKLERQVLEQRDKIKNAEAVAAHKVDTVARALDREQAERTARERAEQERDEMRRAFLRGTTRLERAMLDAGALEAENERLRGMLALKEK